MLSFGQPSFSTDSIWGFLPSDAFPDPLILLYSPRPRSRLVRRWCPALVYGEI